MENVTLAQYVYKNLIVCCPLLKTLRLLSCDGLCHLKMDAPKLELLEVEVDESVFEMVNHENTLNLADVSITLAINDDLRQYLVVRALPGKLPQPCLCLKFLSISIHFKALKEFLAALCLLRSSPALQELEIFDFTRGEEDMKFSSFSSGTERAVKTWQASLDAPQDGIVTAELLEQLYTVAQIEGLDNKGEDTNGAAVTSATEISEFQQTLVKECVTVTEVEVFEHRVFSPWREPLGRFF
ncbi:hypothetical protein ACE6H2_027577 [Prunus campanulata]